MRIGIDIRSLMAPERTGVGEYVFQLLNALFFLDKENEYWLFYNSHEDVSANIPGWNQENVRFVSTKYPNKLLNFGLSAAGWPRLDKLIERRSGALDVFFSPNLNFTAVSPKIKFILTIHDLSFEFFPDCFSAKQRIWHKIINPRKQCRRADLILTPSDNTRRDLIKEYGIDEKKVKRIYPGLSGAFLRDEKIIGDEQRVRTKYGLPDKYILYLGTIEPRKNVVGIIEAYREANLLARGFELIIAGAKGWKYEETIELMNKTAGVKYIGYVDEGDKAVLYRMASLFAYPSFYEGFGFPVVEAMASGVPVITGNRSALVEAGGDGVYLVNPYNVSEIATGMKLMLENNRIAELYRSRGLEQARKFRWESTARELLEILK
ncbi:MAG: glycosyltransferase family 1 protein [Patescibacteria group bacterium]